jgi:WD40 repeat protein
VAWSASDRWLDVLTQDQRLILVDLTQPAIVSSLPGTISAAAWHPTRDRLAIAYPDMRVQIRDIASNAVILERFAAGQQVAWSADGSEFATAIESGTVLTTTGYQMPLPAYNAILFWDAQTGQIQHSIELPHQISLKTIDFVTPTLIGGYCTEYNEIYWSDQACVWDRATGEFAHRYSIAGGSSSLGGMAWSSDGRYLSAVTVWHTLWTDIFPVADAGSEDYVDEIDSIDGVWLAWTPDSRYLTATDGTSILQYDVETQTTRTITLN